MVSSSQVKAKVASVNLTGEMVFKLSCFLGIFKSALTWFGWIIYAHCSFSSQDRKPVGCCKSAGNQK